MITQRLKPVAIGSATTLIGLLFSFTYQGVQFNFKERLLKNYVAVLGIKIGKWIEMPPFQTVTIARRTFSYQSVSNGISPSYTGKTTAWEIALYTDELEPELVLLSENEKTALQDVTILASHLNIAVQNQLNSLV